MTERPEHGDGRRTPAERPNRPTALWLTAIPMVVASAVGLIGAHPRSSEARSAVPVRSLEADQLVFDRVRAVAARTAEAATARSLVPAFASSTSTTTRPAVVRSVPAPAPHPQPASGCAAALQWLWTHSAPGFRFECPGYSLGHQGMTCVDVAGVCPGQRIIAIADACPAAYMNEAHNSWILTGLAPGRLDPYGSCG